MRVQRLETSLIGLVHADQGVIRREIFAYLQELCSLYSALGDTPEVRRLVLRTLELGAALGAGLEDEFTPILDALVREVGMFQYLSSPDDLSFLDRIAYEYHRPEGMPEKFVFHRPQAYVYRLLLDDQNVILSAPTSFGKSRIIDAMIVTGKYKNIVIVVPTIALIDETFRWAREQGLVSDKTYQDICVVAPLAYGRTEARSSRKVGPVSDEVIDQTLPFCTAVLRGMIELQRHTGMRPAEVCAIREADIDAESFAPVWRYVVPESVYKLSHMENAKPREVFIGPKAREVLKPFLAGRDPEKYLFSPYESELERMKQRGEKRKTPEGQGNGPGTNRKGARARWKPGSCYQTQSYRKAIEYALKRAAKEGVSIPDWNPNQIRHTKGTEVRKLYGIEGASVTLGHTNLRTTEIYAERDREVAVKIAREIG